MLLLIMKTLCVLILIQTGYHMTDACSFPSALRNGTWISSDMGTVTFNSTHFTVSEMVDFGPLTFECIERYSKAYYSLSEPFSYLGVSNPFKVAICFKLKKVSDTKYLYYLQTDVLANTDVNRISFNTETYGFTAAETCGTAGKTISQTRVLVKENYVNVSSIDCPNAISGKYTYNNVTGSSCTNTSMDTCTDDEVMTFNYTLCSDIMAYSAGGVLRCVHSTESESDVYVILYNEDATTDESTYYRYTCMVVTASGNNVSISTYPRACLEQQNTTSIASPGTVFELDANLTCPTITTLPPAPATQDDTSTLSAGGAAAVVLGLLVLFAVIGIFGGLYYFKVFRRKKVNPDKDDDMIPAKSPPIDTKEHDSNLDGRVSPFSPYPTVSELAVYRFGPSPGPEIDDDDGGMTLEATTPGFTDGRRTMYGKDVERESQVSLPMYSEVGGETPEPTRLSEVHTRMSEISEVNIADPTTMTRATMNIPEETGVSPLQTPTESKPNGLIQSPRDNGDVDDVTL